MSAVVHHLVRRGFEATQQNWQDVSPQEDQPDEQIRRIPTWGVAALWATFIAFIFLQFMVSQARTISRFG